MSVFRSESGFSIVELMIAMALSLLLGIGIFQVFTANQQSARLTQSLTEVQEVGRLSTEVIARDIRNADYWGCAGSVDSVRNGLDTADPGYDAALHGWGDPNAEGLRALNNVPDGTEIGGREVIPGTDVLILRSLSARGITVGMPMNTSTAVLFVANAPNFDLAQVLAAGDIVAVSDCISADIFQITNFNAQGGGTPGQNVVHNAGGNQVPGNATPGLSREYGTGSQILVPVLRVFFLTEDANGVPTLVMGDESGSVNVLADWVENLQFTFGEDTNGDGVVDVFANAAGVANMQRVLSVSMTLTVASNDTNIVDQGIAYSWNLDGNGDPTPLPEAEDLGRLRRLFSATSSIRSRLP